MTPSTMTVRPAHAGDFARLRGMLISSYLEYGDRFPGPAFAAYLTDLVDLEGRADFGEILVAERDGAMVGTATFYGVASDDGSSWPASASSLRALAVPPSYRGFGVAGAIVEACVERARARGSALLCLHSAPFMPGAIRAYEGAGFVRAPEFDVDLGARMAGVGAGGLVIGAYVLDLATAAAAAASAA